MKEKLEKSEKLIEEEMEKKKDEVKLKEKKNIKK